MEATSALTADPTESGPEEAAEPTAPEAVVVRFGGARYAVAMADVAEVVLVPELTRVPGAPAWLTGVVNWRGRVLAVVDLRSVVGAEVIPSPSSARLVVLASEQAEAGLLVEAVTGLLAPDLPAPTPVPATVAPEVASLLLGVVDDGGPVSLVDASAVLELRSRVQERRRSGPADRRRPAS